MVVPCHLSRREFVKCLPVGLFGLGGVLAQEIPDLVVAKNDLPEYLARAAVKELGGIGKYVKEGDLVVVKPNFSWDCMPNSPTNAANTDPDLVRAVVRMCLEAGASEIRVVDNTLTNPPELGLRSSQIERKLSELDSVKCKVLNKKPSEFEKMAVGGSVGEIGFSKDVLEADVFVNMPKLKVHSEAVATISMKNLMGLVDDRGKMHDHGLHRSIADLTKFLLSRQDSSGQRSLVVVDAIRVLQTGGPGGPGKVIQPNCVLAGENPVSIDAYGCGLLGIQTASVTHIDIASSEYALGPVEGLRSQVLDVSQMSEDELVPYLPPPGEADGTSPGYLIPLGIAAAAGLGAAFVYFRRKRDGAGSALHGQLDSSR